jgi:DNA polymerase phi
VLDLVDIFLKTRSESPLVIRCMLPLVDLITATGTDEKQLADKASGILRSRFGKAREVPTLTTADVADALLTMEEIHSRARRASNQDVLATLSQCSVYLSRTLLVGSADSVLDVYRKSLGDFASRKASGLNGSFFHDFARRQAAQAWELRMDALDAAGQAVNAYRKVQVLQVIQTLLAQGSSIVRHNTVHVRYYKTDPIIGRLRCAIPRVRASPPRTLDLHAVVSSSRQLLERRPRERHPQDCFSSSKTK